MKTLIKFKEFVDEINLENGRNYKLAVLEKYKDDESVKYFLQQVYDPFLVFGISDKKLNKDVGHQSGTIWFGSFPPPEESVIFEYLKEHNTGTDKDIWTVQQFRAVHVPKSCLELFDKIVTKNLILGISAATINKIFSSDTIHEFNVMLANKYFDKPEVIEGREFAITTKIDGMRCIMMKENGNVTFWSRQGQPIEGLVDLEEEAKSFPDSICLDGELVAKDTSKEDTYKNTMKTARTKDAEKHNLKMMVFDWLPLEDFKNQSSVILYNERRNNLNTIFDKNNLEYFTLLQVLYQGSDTTKVEELLREQVSKGEEGVMLNILNAPYEFKRTSSLLKVKLMKDIDLEVVDYFEGENSLQGTLGGFIVKYKDNIVRVGSGFTKDFREDAWTHPNDYIGKIISIQYFEVTKNADGKESLRFPVFLDIRDDKFIPDA